MTFADRIVELRRVPAGELQAHPENWRRHPAEQRAAIQSALEKIGFADAVIARVQEDGSLQMLDGHLRAGVAADQDVPVLVTDLTEEEGRLLLATLDPIAQLAQADQTMLTGLLEGLRLAEDDALAQMLARLTMPQQEEPQSGPGGSGGSGRASVLLRDRFLVPPFSVLDARAGYWQERKREWLGLGIASEIGRPQNLLKFSDTILAAQQPKSPNRSTPASDSGNDPAYYYKKQAIERELGREITTEEFQESFYEGPESYQGGTSVFDPVLCELAYRWFCPPGGSVLDPFAGGSVRGIVAAVLGRHYVGVELRGEQIEANRAQAQEILGEGQAGAPGSAEWLDGDARDALTFAEETDLVFTCPPYYDLERYSDDPADLSNAPTFAAFMEGYRLILEKAAAALRENRFMVLVVSEIRDDGGICYGLVPETIRACQAAGLTLYNEAVLVQPIGSLALRVGRIFPAGRKLGRCHQNVLVFCKGDPMKATAECGEVELPLELLAEPQSDIPAETFSVDVTPAHEGFSEEGDE